MDRKHGWGAAYFKSGNRYEGDWDQDRMHGVGKFLYATGDIYEGEWDSNRKSGFGTWTFASGDHTYAGEWLADLRHGDGLLLQQGTLYVVSYTHGRLVSTTLAPPCVPLPKHVERGTSSPTLPPKPPKAKCFNTDFAAKFPEDMSLQGRDYVSITVPILD